MGIFVWSYPPGAANDPNAPWNQEDPPCDVCGKDCADCICPECPICHANGDPGCYDEHGLERSDAQIASSAKFEAADEAKAVAEQEDREARAEKSEFGDDGYWKEGD